MQVQITASRQIIAFGHFPTPPADPAIQVVDIDDSQAPLLTQLGTKSLAPDDTITVTPPGIDPLQQAIAQQAAAAKQTTITDLVAAYRPLAANPPTQAAAGVMLKMALGVAANMGFVVEVADLPADLQSALASLPSGA